MRAKCEPSTHEAYVDKARYLKDFFGAKRIDQIESNEVLMRKYIEKRKSEIKAKQTEQGRTPEEVTYTSINRVLALMRAMLIVLMKAENARENPVSLVTVFQEVEKERILTEDEEQRLFQAIEKLDKRGDHLKDFVVIALHPGMRLRKILYMHCEWINLKEGVIIVPRQNQKRKKKDKRVPINSEIRPIVERLVKGEGGTAAFSKTREQASQSTASSQVGCTRSKRTVWMESRE